MNVLEVLAKILRNILTALYEPFGFSLLLSFLAMFFYLYAYEPIHAGKGWNGWVDVHDRAYVLYPLAGLAEDLQSSISSVTRALRELEAARLIERRSNGFSKPNQIFLGVPRTAQKCTIEMAQNEQPYCSKVSNTVAQNCTSNQINKNNLRLNQLNRTKEAYGRYRNVFLEDYSELEMEIAELDTLIEDLSAYMQSTGRKYADHQWHEQSGHRKTFECEKGIVPSCTKAAERCKAEPAFPQER